MTTNSFPPDLAEEIHRRMESGRYATEEDVLRDAFEALKWRDNELVALQEGIDDMNAGRIKPLAVADKTIRDRKNISE